MSFSRTLISNDLSFKVGLLKLNDICMLQLGELMFYDKSSLLPVQFDKMFLINSEIHSFNTRNSFKYHVPPCRTNIRKFSVCFQGPKFFNSLPILFIYIYTTILFKKELKHYLSLNY